MLESLIAPLGIKAGPVILWFSSMTLLVFRMALSREFPSNSALAFSDLVCAEFSVKSHLAWQFIQHSLVGSFQIV